MIASPRDILDFWFKQTPSSLWFAADATFDAAIRNRFEETWRAASEGTLTSWEETQEGAFALILVLDQFPRNMFRGRAEAFSTDALARATAERAVGRGFDLEVPVGIRHFFYLPMMHSENARDQDRCVDLIKSRCGADHYALPFAIEHRETIMRFKRFPARNEALGRVSTAEERAFLAGKTSLNGPVT